MDNDSEIECNCGNIDEDTIVKLQKAIASQKKCACIDRRKALCPCELLADAIEIRNIPRVYGVPPKRWKGCASCYSVTEAACGAIYGPTTVYEMIVCMCVVVGLYEHRIATMEHRISNLECNYRYR